MMKVSELIEKLEGVLLRKGDLDVRLNVWLINDDGACRYVGGVVDSVGPNISERPDCIIYCTDGRVY